MDVTFTSSGLVLPQPRYEPPEIERGVLELDREESRDYVHGALQQMLFLSEFRRSGIQVASEGRVKCEARNRLVMNLAVELLGEDVSFEELT